MKDDTKQLPQMMWDRDIEWYDGPLVSVFIGKDGSTYLWKWLDTTGVDTTLLSTNRWLVTRIRPERLDEEWERNLKDTIMANGWVWIVDTDERGCWVCVECTALENVPKTHFGGL